MKKTRGWGNGKKRKRKQPHGKKKRKGRRGGVED